MIWKLISLVALCSVLSVTTSNGADLYSYKDESFTYILPHGDSKYQFIHLEKPINFFSEKYDHIYINTNGILTFGTEFPDFLNFPFPLEYPSIAPFYSNVDTSNANETSTIILFKSENPEKLQRASNLITLSFTDDYEFEATTLYVATWENVGYFQGKQDKLNTFQAAIICNEDETYVQFTYPSDGINWLKSDAGELGLPDIRAQAGFIAEDGRFFTLPGSGNENARYLSSESNIGIPGVWLYRIGLLDFKSNIQEPNNAQLRGNQIPSRNCAEGLWKKCHSAAVCEDTNEGFSCTCNEGYYGNGFSCIKNNQDIRVTGSISGSINGKQLEDKSKLQSYVVLSDGRSYTAINPINEELGNQLKLATPIGGAIGWLFAKPVGDGENIWNGFQFTGGKLNHFSTLRFTQTGEVFQINQTFDGLNYWDQLVVNIEVSGQIPNIPLNEKFLMNDYVEEFNQLSRNAIQSVSNRKIEIQSLDKSIDFEVEHLITFGAGSNKMNTEPPRALYQRLSKISIDYFMHEQALRVGVLAKIGTTVETHPCQDGTANCGENTKCIEVEGDEYDCMCLNGYMPDESIEEIVTCIDIDECSSPNICDENAICRNIDGGYECRCSSGFVGNGYDCINSSVALIAETQQRETESQTEQDIDNHQEHEITPEYLYPSTSSGYENSYESSTARNDYTEENHCEECSSEADCVGGRCQCRDGFSGDGFYCAYNCESNERWSNGRCVESYKDEQLYEIEPYCLEEIGECTCPDGYNYLEEENICRSALRYNDPKHEEHTIPCDVEFNCSPNATCEWNDQESSYECECLRGYEGDGFECYKIELSCTTKSDLCDPHASCLYVEKLGKSECKCDNGYLGDGFTCQLAPECDHDEHCSTNAYCANGVCLCKEGFERDQSDFCVPAGKCGGTYCTDNAICKWEAYQKVQYCECLEGYIGDGLTSCKSVPPPCNVRNTCGLYASCVPSFRESGKYECVCHTGFYGDGYVCVEEKNCRNTPSLCDQNAQCLTTANGLSCICNQGYLGNGTICNQITHESGFLLISQGVVIIRVPFNGKGGRPITVASMAIGLDKDCVEGRVYWGDISAKKIVSSKYDGSDNRPFITEDVESPEGIAIDSVSRRLYWTDSAKDTIEVASLDNPSLRAVIVHKHLVNPRGIAVDPYKNKLYWSDWNRDAPKIEMSDLDGTGREILLSKPNLILPNSLVVLPSSGELCYVDAGTHRAECIDTYSKEIRTVADTLDYPFGLGASEDHIYWTDWKTKQVESIDLNGNRKQGLRTPFFGSHKMYGMTAIVDSCPLSYSPCQINNGGCTDERICLVQPNAPSSKSCKCTKLSKQCNSEQFYED